MNIGDSDDGGTAGQPARLVNQQDATARSLRSYHVATRVRHGETEAWLGLSQRLFRRRTPRPFAVLAIAGAACAATALWWVNRPIGVIDGAANSGAAPIAAAPNDRNLAAPAAEPTLPELELTSAPRSVPAGPSQIVNRTHLAATPGTRAVARTVGGVAEIALASGALDVQVATGASGQTRVVAGIYTFVDIGTRFAVTRNAGTVALSVTEGTVEVRHRNRLLAVVHGPHGSWSGSASGEPSPARGRGPGRGPSATLSSATPPSATPSFAPSLSPPPTTAPPRAITVPSPPPPSSSCRLPTPGADVAPALLCLDDRARGAGLAAESALYEIARLKRDRLGDSAGAIAALEQHRRRFPAGQLRIEVGLSLVDLLPRVGRYRDALRDSAALLADNPRLERADELRLLRGNIYREGLADCASALREYRTVSRDAGRVSSDSLFYQSACLDQLGRRDEARAGYRAYLDLPDASRSDDARQRLKTLGP